MEEIFETLRKQIKGDFDQNYWTTPYKRIYKVLQWTQKTIWTNHQKLSTMEEDLNLLSEELLEQIFVYLNDIDWEEDQIDNILGQILEIEEELELDKDLILLPNFPYINTYLEDYKYLVIYESPKYILLQDIPNQLYDYLEQIELFPFQGYSTTYQELEYNYNYHIRYRTK